MPTAVSDAGGLAALKRENEHAMYDIAFNSVMERWVSGGTSFRTAVEESPFNLDVSRFRAWIMSDPDRKQKYYEAQELAAEDIADQMIDIADAKDSMEDVNRSALKISTRKWLIAIWNKRYRDTKQIEQTVTFNMVDAMAEARARVERRLGDVVDAQVKELK